MKALRVCDACQDKINGTAYKIGMFKYCKECALQARKRVFQVQCCECGKDLTHNNKCVAYLYAGDYHCKDCFLDSAAIED